MVHVEYVFGENFRLDVTHFEIWQGERKLKLTSTSFRIFVCIIEGHDRYWNPRDVGSALGIPATNGTLRWHVGKIRKCLGDDAKNSKFFHSNGHGGYRFIGELRLVTGDPAAAAAENLHPITILEPVADAPSPILIGTTWQRQLIDRTGEKHTVWTLRGRGALEGRDVYLISSGATTLFWDVTTLNHMAAMHNGKITSTALPSEGVFSWPLFLGKSWESRFRYRDYVDVGDFNPVSSRYTVVSYEDVTVPAGTFMAFRIDGTPTRNESVTRVAWYAPKPGIVVKRIWDRSGESDYRGTSLRAVMELVSYPIDPSV